MKDNSGPAFPSESGPHIRDGLTKREYFSGQALMGLLSNPNNSKELSSDIVDWSVSIADYLLAELAKEE